MSTILDSLKKSSDKRDGTDKNAIDSFNFGSKKGSSKLVYMLFVVVLTLVVFVLLYWGYNSLYNDGLSNSSTDKTEIPNTKTAINKTEMAKPDNETRRAESRQGKRPKPNSNDVKQKLKTIQEEKDTRRVKRQAIKDKLARDAKDKKDQKPLLELTKTDRNPDDETKRRIDSKKDIEKKEQQPQSNEQEHLYVYQLPFNIRKDIPKLTLNIHVYDKMPENRIAIINGERFVIDDMIDDHVLVKDITKQGVLLEFNETEFLVPR